MKVTLFIIGSVLLSNGALYYLLDNRIRLGREHYIASFLGPLSLHLLLFIVKHPVKTFFVVGSPVHTFQLSIAFLLLGYVFGWIEIGIFNLARLFFRSIWVPVSDHSRTAVHIERSYQNAKYSTYIFNKKKSHKKRYFVYVIAGCCISLFLHFLLISWLFYWLPFNGPVYHGLGNCPLYLRIIYLHLVYLPVATGIIVSGYLTLKKKIYTGVIFLAGIFTGKIILVLFLFFFQSISNSPDKIAMNPLIKESEISRSTGSLSDFSRKYQYFLIALRLFDKSITNCGVSEIYRYCNNYLVVTRICYTSQTTYYFIDSFIRNITEATPGMAFNLFKSKRDTTKRNAKLLIDHLLSVKPGESRIIFRNEYDTPHKIYGAIYSHLSFDEFVNKYGIDMPSSCYLDSNNSGYERVYVFLSYLSSGVINKNTVYCSRYRIEKVDSVEIATLLENSWILWKPDLWGVR